MKAGGLPGPPPDSRARFLVVLTILVAGLLLLAAVGYLLTRPSKDTTGAPNAPSLPAPTRIELLPSEGTPSACIVDDPGAPRPTLALDNGTFQANTYNVPAGTTGHVGMCYDAGTGSMFSYANWTRVGATGWFSYPSLAYGVNEWAGADSTYTGQGPAWTIPQPVGAVVNESLWVVTNYTFRAPNASATNGYDLSLDDFFTDSQPPVYGVGPFVEVMVWFAHHISYPAQFANWSAPTLVNSTVATEPWSIGDWCHGVDNGSNENVSFDFSYDGQGTQGASSGTIGVDLSLFLAKVEQMMPSAACWEGPRSGFSHLYLDEANLGSEDGALDGSAFNYNWTVRGYCFFPGVQAPTAANLACGPGMASPVDRDLRTTSYPGADPTPAMATVRWDEACGPRTNWGGRPSGGTRRPRDRTTFRSSPSLRSGPSTPRGMASDPTGASSDARCTGSDHRARAGRGPGRTCSTFSGGPRPPA
jgi:hypothetical protein